MPRALLVLAMSLAMLTPTLATSASGTITVTGHVTTATSNEQFWYGIPAAGLPFTITMTVVTDVPGMSFADYGGWRYMLGGDRAIDPVGAPRSPSPNLYDFAMTIGGYPIYYSPSEIGQTWIEQKHTGTSVEQLGLQFYLDQRPPGDVGHFALNMPVTYALPNGMDLPAPGVYLVGPTQVGTSGGGISHWENGYTYTNLSYVLLEPEVLTVSASIVPEPAVTVLLLSGLGLLHLAARRPRVQGLKALSGA